MTARETITEHRTDTPDRRTTDVTPAVERRLSPMAQRVLANKAEGLRTGGDRPMGWAA